MDTDKLMVLSCSIFPLHNLVTLIAKRTRTEVVNRVTAQECVNNYLGRDSKCCTNAEGKHPHIESGAKKNHKFKIYA